MGEVRDLALGNPGSEPLITVDRRHLSLALNYALLRLQRKPSAEAKEIAEVAVLRSKLPQLWRHSLSEQFDLLWNMTGLNKEAWSSLIQLSGRRKAELNLLTLHPDARKLFTEKAYEEAYKAAEKSFEDFLEEAGGGALHDYPVVIRKMGEKMCYGHPFPQMLLSSLCFRPLACHHLIRIASECELEGFFQFVRGVNKHCAKNVDALATLVSVMTRKLASADKHELSALPFETLRDAMYQVGHLYCDGTALVGASAPILEMVKDERQKALLRLAKNISAIVESIPQTETECRAKILKPMMQYLRSQPSGNKEARDVKQQIKARAKRENWLPDNPYLKF